MTDEIDELHLDIDELEALAARPGSETSHAHVATCAACQEELAWMRTEAALFASRRQAAPRPDFDAVAARLAAQKAEAARKRRSRWLTISSALPAAAALSAALLLPRPRQNIVTPEPPNARLELQRAEHEVSEAARVLEAKYKRKVAVLGNNTAVAKLSALTEVRTQVLAARAQAGDDVEARQVALEGYTTYVQELHRVVAEMDQVKAQ